MGVQADLFSPQANIILIFIFLLKRLRGRSASAVVTSLPLKGRRCLRGDGGRVRHGSCWPESPSHSDGRGGALSRPYWAELKRRPGRNAVSSSSPHPKCSRPVQTSPGSPPAPLPINHGPPVGAVCLHAHGVRGHSDGCGGGESQPVHLWAHHAAHVPGAALQLHLHAQHTQPLRPANSRPRHGGRVSLLYAASSGPSVLHLHICLDYLTSGPFCFRNISPSSKANLFSSN